MSWRESLWCHIHLIRSLLALLSVCLTNSQLNRQQRMTPACAFPDFRLKEVNIESFIYLVRLWLEILFADCGVVHVEAAFEVLEKPFWSERFHTILLANPYIGRSTNRVEADVSSNFAEPYPTVEYQFKVQVHRHVTRRA